MGFLLEIWVGLNQRKGNNSFEKNIVLVHLPGGEVKLKRC